MTTTLGQPQTGGREKWPATGLILAVLGGAVCLASTLFAWSIDTNAGIAPGLPIVDLGYWTGLTPTNLATVPVVDRWLWLADVVVTLAVTAIAVWAAFGLAGSRPPAWRLTLCVGIVALSLFLIETAHWLVGGAVVISMTASIGGAVLLIAGGVLCRAGAAAGSPVVEGPR